MWHPHRHQSDHELLLGLYEKVESLMATLEEVQASLATLTADLESIAATAKAEFDKLEKELSEGHTEPNLAPLKEAIDSLDARAKAAAGNIPTN